MTTIIGLKLNNRTDLSNNLQEILSLYGCYINFRIGLHNTFGNKCNNYGIILLEFIGDKKIYKNFIQELRRINNLEIKIIRFA